MASCLLKSECIDLENKLYKMTWWATAINQITVPSGMNMAGGSVAVITTGSGVSSYHYNASQNSWKQDSSIGSIQQQISALSYSVEELNTIIGWLSTYRFYRGAYVENQSTTTIEIPRTPTPGGLYLLLLKIYTSATTFVYDLIAITFSAEDPPENVYFTYVVKNTTSTSMTSVSVSDEMELTLTFSDNLYFTPFFVMCGEF